MVASHWQLVLLQQQLTSIACCLLLLLPNAAAASPKQNSSSCFSSDFQALTSFSAGLDAFLRFGDSGFIAMNQSWNRHHHDCCSWEGVSCSSIDNSSSIARRVTALSLYFENFSVSSAPLRLEPLCNLSLLSALDLSSAGFPGKTLAPVQIPQCLGEQLPLLENLSLVGLNLRDPIPSSLSHHRHLRNLDLDSNIFLSGPLPTFNTPLLESLSLVNNNLSSSLDQFTRLSNLTALTHLDLSSNSISGPIPSTISRLLNLQFLFLESNSLSGALPDALCKLSNLVFLDLSDNLLSRAQLRHSDDCSHLINLTTFYLFSNSFTGLFPAWIGHFSSLTALDLSYNQFASSVLPDEWQNLRNLKVLYLGSTNSSASGRSSTRLPDWLFRLPHLKDLMLVSLGLQSDDVRCSTRVSMLNQTLRLLYLSGNNIIGRDLLDCFALQIFQPNPGLDVSLSQNPLSISLSDVQLSPAVQSLRLRACNLTGTLNSKLFSGSLLDLSHNHLVGKIPTSHTNLTGTVRALYLSSNYFSGFESHGRFLSLCAFDLSNNIIADDISTVLDSLGSGLNCSRYYSVGSFFSLSYNRLSGQIPGSLAERADRPFIIDLSHNNLTGQIPDIFGKHMPYISGYFAEYSPYILQLSDNHLTGIIPSTIISKNSVCIDLRYNDLEGKLKPLFSSLHSPSLLAVLSLAHNRISGSIPSFLGSLTPYLIVIDLSYNNLTGTIPRDLYLPSFVYETLEEPYDYQVLIGSEIPPLVMKGVTRTFEYVLTNFRFLDLSENGLEGAIPSELGDLAAMMQLNLSHNRLSGQIPEAFGKLSLLETLDLSFNKLRGSIPPSLSGLTKLAVFNVSYNGGLVGPIPTGSQLDNNDSYIGDPLLCSYDGVLQRSCEAQVDASKINASNNYTVGTWMDEWVAVPGLCLGIVVGFSGVLWLLHGPGLPYRWRA